MRPLRPAEILLQDLGVDHPDNIDLDAIAYHVGCQVRYRPLEGCEARIVGSEDSAVISISIKVSPVRRRFSLGHELGHWFHHRGKSFICRADDIGNEARSVIDPERVADGYAADLLLPAYLFGPRIRAKTRPSFRQIEEVAHEFKVSIPATALRFADLSPHPIMLVCHNQAGRRWFKRGVGVPERWWPRDDLDPESYAFDVLFKAKERTHSALMPASAWFDRLEANACDLYEETIRHGEDEVLTLLCFKDDGMMEEIAELPRSRR